MLCQACVVWCCWAVGGAAGGGAAAAVDAMGDRRESVEEMPCC